MLLRLATKYFDYLDMPPIESALEFHLTAYREMVELDERKRTAVSLILFNYTLLKHDIPTIHVAKRDFESYKQARASCLNGNSEEMYKFMFDLLNRAKFQNKSFYENLKPLTIGEIINRIRSDEEMLRKDFSIKSIVVFGSFAKDLARIDSDIDLYVAFSLDLSYSQKLEFKEYLTTYYEKIFSRFLDITEASEYITDELIKTMPQIRKIF